MTSYDGYLFGEDIGLVVYGRTGRCPTAPDGVRCIVATIPAADLPVVGSLGDAARAVFLERHPTAD